MKQGLLLTLLLSSLVAQAAEKKPWELEWVGAAKQAANNCVGFTESFKGARCSIIVRGEQGFDILIESQALNDRHIIAGMSIAGDICNAMKMRVALVIKSGTEKSVLAAFMPPRCEQPEVFDVGKTATSNTGI